jgi:hypothetical protein
MWIMKTLLPLIILLLGSTACLSEEMKAETVVYRDVRAGVSPDNSAEKVLQYDSNASPEFLVDAGTLYLRIQRTYTRYGLYVVVDKEHWNGQKLQQLIKSHPELDPLFPDSRAGNGGIRWIEQR